MLSIVSLFLNVTIGAFINLVGAAGSALSQSSALSSSRTLILQPSATGDFPRFKPDMSAPSIGVGAGGHGAKSGTSGEAGKGDESLMDKVGKIIDGSEQQQGESSQSGQQEEGTVLRERRADEPSNPKKRMFEEPPPPRQEGERLRDEL
jgi:protein transport protein SEC20